MWQRATMKIDPKTGQHHSSRIQRRAEVEGIACHQKTLEQIESIVSEATSILVDLSVQIGEID